MRVITYLDDYKEKHIIRVPIEDYGMINFLFDRYVIISDEIS